MLTNTDRPTDNVCIILHTSMSHQNDLAILLEVT